MSHTQRRVLMVEDDEATAGAVRVLLHHHLGSEVYWAANIAEARSLLAEHQPDVVLLDLMLPGGDGEELLRDLVEDNTCPRIVVLTACAPGSARVRRAEAIKPTALVFKPYDLVDLLCAITGEPPDTVSEPDAPSVPLSLQVQP